MPQKSKSPSNKANQRALSAPARSNRAAAKVSVTVAKRSVVALRSAKATAKAKPKSAPEPVKAAARVKKAARPKQALRTAPREASAKPKPPSALPKPRTMHALILPPKPKRQAARLLVARAPRVARLEQAPPEANLSIPVSAATARATSKPANAELEPVSLRASASCPRARTPRSSVTLDTWRSIEALAVRLGRAPLIDEQRVAIRAALEGHDSLVVLPEDERALSCYQLAAFQLTEPSLVISPVPANLRAQYQALSARQLPVVCIPPELGEPERAAALARIARGGALLVLLCPEGLHAPDIRQALAKSGIALLVVEEAHCASEASHELRPSFAELAATLRGLDSPPVMAITRVATANVRRDIRERLGLAAPVTIQSAPVRENLQIVTKLARGEGRQAALVRLVERLALPGLVFCATPHDVDSVYSALRGAGIAAHRHHSGMTAAEREAESANFSSPGQRSVMVAVSAFVPGSGLPGIGEQADATLGFGRGPQRPDVRFVVHYQSPASLEQYLREIQLAGADGLPATCVLMHESSHRSLHEVMLAQQRFRATHLAELGRALEAPALEGRTVSLEALALGTGQSRRTTNRLTALLADAGVVSRVANSVRVLCTASELDAACRRLGAQLYALREQDARRLASVSAFAEARECKLSCLSQYLGDGPSDACGRCNACVSELSTSSQDSLAPEVAARRGPALEFSVQPVGAALSGVVPSGAHPAQSSRVRASYE